MNLFNTLIMKNYIYKCEKKDYRLINLKLRNQKIFCKTIYSNLLDRLLKLKAEKFPRYMGKMDIYLR